MTHVRVDEIADIVMGQSPPGESYNEIGEGLPFFQGKAEFGETSPTAKKWCTDPRRVAERGDILMSVRAPVGPTNIASEQCCIGRGLAAIRGREPVEQDFLRYFFRHAEPILAHQGQGSTFAAIGRAEIAALQIPLPTLPEQRRIVDLLSRAEGIVRLRREAQRMATELVPALFLDMFGDPASNPKGWPVKQLNSVGRITTGSTPPSALEGMFDGTIPFMTPGDLDGEAPPKRCVSEDGAEQSRTVRAGATLVCCIGATIGKVGVAEVLSAFNQQINAVEWNAEVNDDYGFTAMRLLKPVVIARATSTTLPILKKSVFQQIEIPAPPIELQRAFAAKADAVRGIAAQQASALVAAQAAFDALLSRAFTH